MLTFTPIAGEETLSRQQDYKAMMSRCPQISSDYTFLNLWGWAEAYGLEWAWENCLIWIRQTLPDIAYWAPIGAWHEVEWESIRRSFIPSGAQFIRVPEMLSDIWQQNGLGTSIEEARGHWDYLYETRDLVELKGNRFHKKKNLLNQFLKKHVYTFLPFGPSLVSQAISLQNDWCEWRDCESSETLASENKVIEKTLTHWEKLDGLLGGGIQVDGVLIAYTVAEPMSDNMVVIHFEKANSDIIGAYQAINQMFLASLPNSLERVNREQDLDDPGLRKAKLSYNPSGFLKKYSVLM